MEPDSQRIPTMGSKNARRILLTGGAGFVGSHLAEMLLGREENDLVVVADNFFLGSESNVIEHANLERFVLERVDCSSQSAIFKLIQKYQIDTIWNLAVVPLPTSLKYPEWTIQNNIACALAIAEASIFFPNLRVINISSSEIYGSAQTIPMDESHPMAPETPYAASKAAADLIFDSYSRTFDRKFLTLRPFNMFGPRQNQGSYAGVIPIFIKTLIHENKVTIFGDGMQTRDFVFVRDSVNAMLQAENCWDGSESLLLNIGTGKETSVIELVSMLTSILEISDPIIEFKPPRDGDVRRHLADSQAFSRFTKSSVPAISKENLRETVKWYESQS
jgi:UDP-glucose 4-epimerase